MRRPLALRLVQFVWLTPFVLPSSARADDGYIALTAGSVQAMESHPTISMMKEYVRIDIYEDSYAVKADFEFFNDGPSATIKVGFPVGGQDPGALADFRTSVNGVGVESTDVANPESKEEDEGGNWPFPRVWKMKTVTFPSKKTTRTSVQYTSPFGLVGKDKGVVFERIASYVYGTGRTWSGPIHEAVFDIRFDEDRDLLDIKDTKMCDAFIHRSRGQIVFKMTELQPSKLDEGINVSLSRPELYQTHPYIFPNLPIEPELHFGCGDDLRLLSLIELRYMRNMVYAARGHVFTDPPLQKLFGAMSWYRPNATADFTKKATDFTQLPDQERRWFEKALQSKDMSAQEKNWIERIQKQEDAIREAKPFAGS